LCVKANANAYGYWFERAFGLCIVCKSECKCLGNSWFLGIRLNLPYAALCVKANASAYGYWFERAFGGSVVCPSLIFLAPTDVFLGYLTCRSYFTSPNWSFNRWIEYYRKGNVGVLFGTLDSSFYCLTHLPTYSIFQVPSFLSIEKHVSDIWDSTSVISLSKFSKVFLIIPKPRLESRNRKLPKEKLVTTNI
jgi:hypothetical protein